MANTKEIKSNIKLRDIDSSYVIEEVFSFLNKKQLPLNLIIYNKELQNFLSIDIDDYKKISGKYKECEKNGKGREYLLNTKILVFEGEYLNVRRNGKGKEYNKDGKIEFEGEFLNRKRWRGK